MEFYSGEAGGAIDLPKITCALLFRVTVVLLVISELKMLPRARVMIFPDKRYMFTASLKKTRTRRAKQRPTSTSEEVALQFQRPMAT